VTVKLPVASDNRAPLLEVDNLVKYFPIKEGIFSRTVGQVHAVDGVTFTIRRGETLGLVGESGCGKSTVGRTVLKLMNPTAGKVKLAGRDITHLSRAQMRPLRPEMQLIFQDPFSSLNPRMTAGAIVREPLSLHGVTSRKDSRERVAEVFERVGLRPEQVADFPHQFSGGQRQRIGIARALVLGPSLIVGDEPVSALDVSIQAQVINLLIKLQDELGLAYLFIAHDLAVVKHISHRVAVMYLGRIVELANKATLFRAPLHPYTKALLSAVPVPDPRARSKGRTILKGDVPSPINPPNGCHFHERCPYVMDRCKSEAPVLLEKTSGHWAACHLED
jgi:peptide/nickel transport system ATP-binding protein/oligopeptide transport system ATP-binding protein|tara:strand:+ start:263 stop:1264 length:1002 start_codon:yes stop_codon:yes gene_type:complete